MERQRGEPLYVCTVNPHQRMECVNHKEGTHKLWRCVGCLQTGTLDNLGAIPCPIVQPPCEHCGLTPVCAWDCKGIWGLLNSPDIYLVGP